MPQSLKAIFKKLKFQNKISQAEYELLCKKLDGHDAVIRAEMSAKQTQSKSDKSLLK